MSINHQPNALCWIDLGTPDPETAEAFYASAFGWEIAAPDPTEYQLCRLDGGLVGALGRADDPGLPYWTTYISVTDADGTAQRVTKAGGTLTTEPEHTPGIGTFIITVDPNGAPLTLFQPDGLSGVERRGPSGTWTTSHLFTPSPERSAAYYYDVFGWTTDSAVSASTTDARFILGGSHVATFSNVPTFLPLARTSQWIPIFTVDENPSIQEATPRGRSTDATFFTDPQHVLFGVSHRVRSNAVGRTEL
jgi:uncharacterized protein